MARIALGSNVREGPRRGQVVGHRPKGMVDVQFEDVGWVERRQEKSLRKGNPADKRGRKIKELEAKVDRLRLLVHRDFPATGTSKAYDALIVDLRKAEKELRQVRKRAGIYSLNPAGKGDYYDPAREQFRRQQMAIYESQKERGLSDKEAWQSSWAIATRVGQKHGWLKKGTQEPTAKGRRGAKEKLKSGDAWAKRQKYELELSRRRKSGKHRVVPQRQGKQTRYYVQPGGR